MAKAGYTHDDWKRLEEDLRTQILPLRATPIEPNRFGQKYSIVGELIGINGVTISVETIWIIQDGATRFVTLLPFRR